MTAAGPEAVQPATAQHHVRAFPARPEQVREARTFLKGVLAGCPAAEDAALCLSELATNACLHSDSRQPGGQFTVRIQACGPGLRVEVSDQGGSWTPPASDGHAPSGRGLRIVGQLARTWGRTGNASTGWTTWFEIGSPPTPRTTPEAAPGGGSQRWISAVDGQQLWRLRHQHGLSQDQLAATAGISQSTVARLEPHPHITCRSRTLARLAAALGYPPATLVSSPDPARRNPWSLTATQAPARPAFPDRAGQTGVPGVNAGLPGSLASRQGPGESRNSREGVAPARTVPVPVLRPAPLRHPDGEP